METVSWMTKAITLQKKVKILGHRQGEKNLECAFTTQNVGREENISQTQPLLQMWKSCKNP